MSAWWKRQSARGSISVELAVLTPAFLMLIVIAIAYGRVSIAANAVDVAAHDAARAASISRSAGAAELAAVQAAEAALNQQGLLCVDGPNVRVDTSGFADGGLDLSYVIVDVSCTVPFTDLPLLPIAASGHTVETRFVSAIDVFRER